MARPTSVVATTDLGAAIERCRGAAGLTRKDVYEEAGTSSAQYGRLLTEQRRFEVDLVCRVARAVGLEELEALRLARIAVVPDDTLQVVTLSRFHQLAAAS